MAEVKRKVKQVSMREHIRKRPMWAGAKKVQACDYYVLKREKDEVSGEEYSVFDIESIKYSPVLLKIIDEIVVNAIDQHIIYPKVVNKICINVYPDGLVSIYNNGHGITVEETENNNKVKMYTPQLIFSEFFAGSNLDDEEDIERVVGGQNGLGAKITSVYSTHFTVETFDDVNKIYYTQVFRDGLNVVEPPKLVRSGTPEFKELTAEQKKGHTRITFMPDYNEFKLVGDKFYPTLVKIVESRAWQAAAYVSAKVYFNDKEIPLKSFADFCKMFTDYEIYPTTMTQTSGKFPWEICLSVSDGKERHLSIVNGICITGGGEHIKHIQNQIVEHLKDNIEKELKQSKTKFNKNLILNNVFIFMKGPVPNADFLGQVKEAVKNPIETFANYKIPATDWIKIWRMIGPTIMASFLKKQLGNEILRANRGKINVPKYREAEFCRDAKRCHQCGLIITEGDSATGTAHIGLMANASETFNYNLFGTYSIKGVMANGLKESIEYMFDDSGKLIKVKKTKKKPTAAPAPVPKAKAKTSSKTTKIAKPKTKQAPANIRVPNKKIMDNERIASLVKVLGLDFNKKYSLTEEGDKEWKTLRYGYVAGLTDQDLDGFNIFGLLATFFMTYWPDLIKRGFIRRINTPLIRARPKNKTFPVKEFYTTNQFNTWVAEVGEDYVKRHYDCKYYKGLGSHNQAFKEVSQMFTDINEKICTYILDEEAIQNMTIYYGEETANRKIALSTPVSDQPIESLAIPLSQQYKIDTKLFQRDNIVRKLLNSMDGFVSSRRKVFYTARKIGNKEIKVAGMASETVSKANYHHGEVSLEQTIVRMAQAYPDARNLPLLQPLGMFGTREMGYKNYAASRYIFTKLNYRLADKLFRPEDEFILEYEIDDGTRCEPKNYAPIIPYVLCENNELPATGWAICVYARDIKAIFKNVREMIEGKIDKCGKLPIWKKDFKGDIRAYGGKTYFVGNIMYDADENLVHITELPPGVYSTSYLSGSEESKKKKNEEKKSQGILNTRELVDYGVDDTTNERVDIKIYLKPGAYEEIRDNYGNEKFSCLEEYFEMKKAIHNRINLVNQKGEVIEYKKYEDVFNDWYVYRKTLYEERVKREIIINDLRIQMFKNMQRFSKEHGKMNITNKTTEEVAVDLLKKANYDIFKHTLLNSPEYTAINELKNLITLEINGASYDYLLNMSYKELTEESYNRRQAKIEEIEERQVYLKDTGGRFIGAKIWLKELDELEDAINKGLASEWFYGENNYNYEKKGDKNAAKPGGRKPKSRVTA